MKKLLFGLIATVLFSFSASAQEMTQEDLRLLFAQEMVSFTNAMKPAYERAKDFNDFEKIVCGAWLSKTTREGHELLKASYNYISEKTADEEILKSYSGKEMAAVALLHNENLKKNIKATGIEIFGGTTGDFNPYTSTLFRGEGEDEEVKCRWWQIACWFSAIFGPVNGPKILDAAVVFIINLFG